ncbi:MAG TPA: DUF4232 domain-containing protein, partial [Streptomyces sp.]|nr:DUF4232 domain-containing protein [Streptomyces sp.]
MRTSIRRPAVLAATAMAALSLTLTACGGGDAGQDKSAPAASTSDAVGTEKKDPAAGDSEAAQDRAGTDDSTGSGSSAKQSSAKQSSAKQSSAKKRTGAKQTAAKKHTGSKAAAPACAAGDVSISAAKQDAVPTTHITLTAKNTSGRSCTLLQY